MAGREDTEALIGQIADEFTDRLNRGESPEISEYQGRYPDYSDLIKQILEPLQAFRVGGESGFSGTQSAVPATVPKSIGDYRILREVGRGGMGVVYEAEHRALGRRVALKILPESALIKPNMSERFDREAKAAAKLHHSNIVPVFGIGLCDGVHHYDMQFIDGKGLDEVMSMARSHRGQLEVSDDTRTIVNSATAVDKSHVASSSTGSASSVEWERAGSAEEVAQLAATPALVRRYFRTIAFIGERVADALSYAHGQGVIHRDIKPSNLMLDQAGVVWVTDFGLAKNSESEGLTQDGDILGTVRFMSPERFSGESDASADIYGLGLTLYELATLSPAFDEEDRARLIHKILHEDPVRPRSIDPRIPLDLETIILKAIERDPATRYRTAGELAYDLRAFGHDEPIRARKSGLVERTVKWARRRPAQATALVSVLVFAIAMTIQTIRVADQRNNAVRAQGLAKSRLEIANRATQAAQKAQAQATVSQNEAVTEAKRALRQAARAEFISKFLMNAFASVDPWVAQGKKVTVKELFDAAAQQVEMELSDEPALQAALHDTIGWSYRNLGEYEASERHLRASVKLYRELEQPAELAMSLEHLVWLLGTSDFTSKKRQAEAVKLAREVVQICQAEFGAEHEWTIAALAVLSGFERAHGNKMLADMALLQVVSGVSGELLEFADVESKKEKVRSLWRSGKKEEVFTYIRSEAESLEKRFPGSPIIPEGMFWVGISSAGQKDYDIAAPFLIEALVRFRRFYGDTHPRVAECLYQAGTVAFAQKKYTEAKEFNLEALELRRQSHEGPHPDVAASLRAVARCYSAEDDYSHASEYYALTAESYRGLKDEKELTSSLYSLAVVQYNQRRYEQAETAIREAIEIACQAKKPDLTRIDRMQFMLLKSLIKQREYRDGLQEGRALVASRRKKFGEEHIQVARGLTYVGFAQWRLGQMDSAADAYDEAIRITESQKRYVRELCVMLGDSAFVSVQQQQFEKARDRYEQLLTMTAKEYGDTSSRTLRVKCDYAQLLATCPDEKLRDLDRVMALVKQASMSTGVSGSQLRTCGEVYYGLGEFELALEIFQREVSGDETSKLVNALWTVKCFCKNGQKDLARETYDALVLSDKQLQGDSKLRTLHDEAQSLLKTVDPS